MRFVFRLIAVISLAAAVVLAVLDATRTVVTGQWRFTSFGESWNDYGPDTIAAVQLAAQHETVGQLWDMLLAGIMALPGWLVLGFLAFGFYALGRRRPGESRYA